MIVYLLEMIYHSYINKVKLSKEFHMTDKGPLGYYFGIQVNRNQKNKTLYLFQEKYIHDVLIKFNMSLCKLISTPMQTRLKLSKDMNITLHSDYMSFFLQNNIFI